MHGRCQGADSLWAIWHDESQHDTVRLEAMKDISWAMLYSNPDSMAVLANLQLMKAQEWNQPKWKAQALTIIGASYWVRGEYVEAMKHHNLALDIRITINDQRGIGASYLNMGAIYYSQGDYYNALDNYQKAVQLFEKVGDDSGRGNCYNNIALIHNKLDNFEQALEYHDRSVQLRLERGDTLGMGASYENIGAIYLKMDSLEKAMEYFRMSYDLRIQTDETALVANTLHDMGEAFKILGDLDSSLYYYQQAEGLFIESNSINGLMRTKTDMGIVYRLMGDNLRSIEYCEEAYNLADSLGAIELQKGACQCLYITHDSLGNTQMAFDYYKEFIALQDTLFSQEKTKELTQKEMQFGFDMLMVEQEQQFALEQQEKDAEIKQQRIYIGAAIGGLALMLVLALVIFRGYKSKQKAHRLITTQKHILEEKNREITDSISYAKRIQEAILPTASMVEKILPEHFILYKPKDIVAGDFYWIEENNGKVMIAAADCTGHGVPGAMVSVVCHNALKRSVREYSLDKPNAILDKTREIVIENFENDDENVQDGMDIGLCVWDPGSQELMFSGANNGLYLVRDGELLETKADKQPIGVYDKANAFTLHELQLQKGDVIYLSTDGYADQFGGPSGKKFKYKPFKQLLTDIHQKPMNEQRQILDSRFSEWQGEIEQVDDVCVIGVRI